MTINSPLVQFSKVEMRTAGGITEVGDYLQNRTEADEVISQLRSRGLPGQLLSGEVCLEEASRDPEDGARWIERSVGYFAQTWRLEDTYEITPYTPTATKAALRLAQIPVLRPILLEEGLPEPAVVEQARRETLQIAKHVGEIIMKPNPYWRTKIKNDCLGILSEVAVLGLAQRYSVDNDITDCWQATASLIGADRGTVRRGAVKDGWDVDIWSQPGETPPEPTIKVQVKSSNHIWTAYKPDIQIVNVSPDLAIYEGESNLLGLKIVRELYTEQQVGRGRRNRLSRKLNSRTEKLLDAIER